MMGLKNLSMYRGIEKAIISLSEHYAVRASKTCKRADIVNEKVMVQLSKEGTLWMLGERVTKKSG